MKLPLEELCFYSYANNGDLHVSRELVKHFIAQVPAKRYTYAHKCSSRVLLDLPLEQIALGNDHQRGTAHRYDAERGTYYVNTWYAMSPSFDRTRCSLNCLVDLFAMHARAEGLRAEMPPVERCIPTVDYSRYHTGPTLLRLTDLAARGPFGKWVLVSNGPTMSGQTKGELSDFLEVMRKVVASHPNVFFFYSNSEGAPQSPNVALTRDVIGLPEGECDLVENGYLSRFCDVIVGRGSGAYTFSYLAYNFADETKTMVCFTDEERTARWVYPTEHVKARVLWSNDYRPVTMSYFVEQAIQG